MNDMPDPFQDDTIAAMRRVLARQHAARRAEGPPGYRKRMDRLERLAALLRDNEAALCESLRADFGHRSADSTAMTEIAYPIMGIRHAQRNMRRWMKDERRPVPWLLALLGARAHVRHQPLGTVGVIAPWNFPVNLTATPLIGILAAGNRAMVKPSELTPANSALLAELFARYFPEDEVAVFTGGQAIGEAFASLPFDHLVFTGAGTIARHVMRAASDNLVPLTLELGGKSPVIISRAVGDRLEHAAMAILDFKLSNAGQVCIAPDYLLVAEDRLQEVVAALRRAAARLYPSLLDNPDYTSLVNSRHLARLESYLADAAAAGVEIVELNPAGENFSNQPHRKMAPRLLINPGADRLVMRHEIFGPLLPVRTYRDIDEAIDHVNRGDRPLALYYFGPPSGSEVQRVLSRTLSGGVTINDIAAHAGCESLPFGGVGPSGMGAYHGYDGFREFSHARAVFKQARISLTDLFGLRPPYGKRYRATIRKMMMQ